MNLGALLNCNKDCCNANIKQNVTIINCISPGKHIGALVFKFAANLK